MQYLGKLAWFRTIILFVEYTSTKTWLFDVNFSRAKWTTISTWEISLQPVSGWVAWNIWHFSQLQRFSFNLLVYFLIQSNSNLRSNSTLRPLTKQSKTLQNVFRTPQLTRFQLSRSIKMKSLQSSLQMFPTTILTPEVS
jgi:hypothetical protein